LNGVFLSLNEGVVQKLKNRKMPVIREYSTKKQVESSEKTKRSIIEAYLSGKQKTCLENI